MKKVSRKKSPSQEKRNLKRTLNFKEKFGKSEDKSEIKEEKFQSKEEKTDTQAEKEEKPEKELNENVLRFEEMCEKVFVIPNYMKDNTNMGIENDITTKLEAKGIKVRKVFVQRAGHPTRGEYFRSIVLIEPRETKAIEESDFEIEKCWVLPSK